MRTLQSEHQAHFRKSANVSTGIQTVSIMPASALSGKEIKRSLRNDRQALCRDVGWRSSATSSARSIAPKAS